MTDRVVMGEFIGLVDTVNLKACYSYSLLNNNCFKYSLKKSMKNKNKI